MPTNTSFSGVNQQLNFSQTAPIAIDDVLVRALTGIAADIPTKSPISFSDLSGKYGVGPIIGALSNSQSSYFTTNATSSLQFLTDVYQANVVWSYNLITGDAITFTSSGTNSSLLLSRSSVGNSAANVGVTASVYYGNTLIGSNTVYVSLQANVYNSNLTFTSTPNGFVSFANGYSNQTASLTVTAFANVPGATINWSITPNNASAFSINGNTVTLTAFSSKAGVVNASSYQLTATVMLSGKVVTGGGVTANVSAFKYSNDFTLNAPANVAVSSNTGPLYASAPFSVSGNAPGTVITWSSSVISGSNAATLTVSSGNLSANLSLLIANATSYNGANSVVMVTANMYSDATLTTLVSSHSANVSLQGLVYGLDYTPPSNVSVTGFTAQTATTSGSATYQAGAFNWVYSAVSGVANVALSSGVAGSTAANITLSDTISQRVGSNTSTWRVTPTISYGSITVSGPTTNVNLNATVQPYNLVISGPVSNTQYANNGPLDSSVNLAVSANTPPGTNVAWSVTKISGSNASLSVANNNQSATLTLSLDANTYLFTNAIYSLTANCYDVSSNWSLNSNTQTITLVAGTYGLVIVNVPVSNTQSGYSAQTATATATATSYGKTGWIYSNTVGTSPSFSVTGTSGNSTATWTQNTNNVATNTVTESWQVTVSDPNSNALVYTSTAQTFSLVAQQNAYSFSVPTNATNTQLLSSSVSNLSIQTTPTCNIPGYTLSNWSSSNVAGGYSFTSNSTSAVIGYAVTLTSAASVAYYTTTVSGQLLDDQGRLVQNFSYPVTLRSYFPNPSVSFSNSAVSGYTAQTASGSYVLTLWNGATSLSVSTSNTGDAPTLTPGTQNTSYWKMNYSLPTGDTHQNLSDTISFQPTISFYEASSSYTGWAVTAALSANNYNPAPVVSGSNSSVANWISAQTAFAVETATCNASIANPVWTWGIWTPVSGTLTSAYLQGAGNNQWVGYQTQTGIGSTSASGYPASATLYVDGTAVATVTPTPTIKASAQVYNPALVISGPTSNTQSAQFTSTASIVLTASANASIPSVSYQVSASPVSGSASVSYGASNTTCTLSVTGLHTTASATYNVTFSVLTNGTVIQSSTKQVSLSATGTVPDYSLTTPGNVSAAGFNFAQTCSSTCYLNGLTSSGDYATWNMHNVSGTTPSWSTPGGSNGYITTTQSRGTVGTTSGTIYQTCNVYDPSGNFIQTLTSGNYSLTSTVYNPAFSVSVANAAVSGGGSLTAKSTISLSANGSVGDYHLTITKSSGATGSVSINAGNTGGSLTLTSSTTANAVYSYNASVVLNGQTIAGPITGTMYSAVTITYTPVSATVSPTLVSNNQGQYGHGTYTLTTSTTTATGSGGNGSYTYEWIRTGGSTLLQPNNATSRTTAFWGTMTVPAHGSNNLVSTFICKISDGTSSANTPSVTASISDTDNT